MCKKNLSPNLAIVDLSIPRVKGLDAIREIKKFSSKLYVIVLTVHNTEEYILAALQAGYVLKDATHAELCRGN